MTTPGVLHYSAEFGDESSLAALFDVVRALLVGAIENGEVVDELVVDSRVHEVLATTKAKELSRGRPLTVLGLAVRPVRAELAPPTPGRWSEA
ncbi:hypothetical protein [Nocardioides sp.]|uniref:hypothetical protein n=1 Tax=Nocardioides sp. TaxID=35761 RepID=UPI003D109221